MSELSSVNKLCDYGEVNIELKKLIEEKGLTRYQLSTAIGTRFEVIDKWCNGKLEKIDADILARICFVLDCQPSDIIVYKK